MKTEKRSFISYLKGLYKKEKDPLLKGLIKELKKRQLGVYTRDDSRKSLVLVHKRLWHENKMPNDEWPDLFTKWDNDDKHETLLVWLEEFGMIPELATESLKDFLTDDEEEEGDRLPYIQ